jgi:TonB-linked SusC/RagA family outer membrane protein
MRRLTLILFLIVFVGINSLMAQTKTITGTVTSSEDGNSVPGVSIVVKGTTIGTITDENGKYSLSVPSDAVNLLYSFIGMVTQDVVIDGRSVINIAMESETLDLDEVVVTGFGIKREKRAVTYQTQKVTADELNTGQQTRAAAGLVGKVAGLQINVQDNGVNPSTQILLRGLRSISGNNEALIVIDGSIASTGAFDALNANDIESLNVLKGASAAALYGSRAANGAIIVVTKSGNKNKRFRVGFTNATTFETVAYMPDFQTEHGTGWDGKYETIENTNWGPRFDGTMRQIGPTMPEGYVLPTQMVPYAPVKDNLKDFYNTGSTIQNTAYVTGGDETGTFYMSLGNQITKGIVPDDEYNRTTARVNATKKLGKVELRLNSSYMDDKTDVVGGSIGDQNRTLYWFVLNTPANIPLSSYSDWDNPASYGYADNYYNAYYQNPYWAVGTNRNIHNSQRLTANTSLSWDILKNLNFTGRVGVNTVWGHGKNWRAYQDYDPGLQPYHSTVSSFVNDSEFQSTTYTGDALLTGDFNFGDNFSLKAIVGTAIYSYKYRYSHIRANNLSIPDFYDVSNGTGQLDASVNESEKRTAGFFGDATIGFRNWAFLNLTGRYDLTSTLPVGDNGYFYPAMGLSVVLTEAIPALQDNDVLSFLKLTASNSTVYNDLSPYQINESYSQSSSFPYGSINGFARSNTAVDTNIKKEKLNSTEVGANLGFFRGRMSFDFSYFWTKTTDLITHTTPSYASASTSYLTNIGQLSGSGYELSLGGKIVQVGDFSWDVNLNFYTYETIVDEIVGDIKEVAIRAHTGYGTYAVVGEAFPQLKAVAYVRDPQGRVVVDGVSGNPVVGEIENMGKTTPDYILGFTNQINFKGLSLAATLDYRGGHVYYAQGSDAMEFTGRSMESVSSDRKEFIWPNSVIKTGDTYVENTNIQTTGAIMDFWQNGYNLIKENYVKDATAFKIRELSLNYTLPASLVKQTNVTVGFIARNLFTSLPNEKYRFSDPEFNNAGGSSNDIGVGGYFTSPPTRSFGFNVNIEF